ncbi:MAG: rhomboid family intramembrane serine protease [Bacteroidales bacterium]|nr:rhomboid family intramembrane serine protease [Bacteroidales bacterium]
MIPLRDNIPSKSFPVVTWFLILVNLVIFLAEVFFMNHQQAESLIYKYGLIPNQIRFGGLTSLTEIRITVFRPFFTNMFLHGGWGHIISNMWILFIFGDNVEDRMGKIGFFLFYVLCGLLASFTHFILYIHSDVPAIGASGAISGVMAAYMLMFPRSSILSFIPIFIIPFFFPIPAVIYIGLWFIGQLFSGASSLMLSSSATGIAFWAHIGGFLGGLLIYRLFDLQRWKK